MTETYYGPVAGGEPELEIARDLARRAIWALPVALVVSFLLWRVDGVLSSAFAIALVVVNFLAAAFIHSRAARISPAVLAAAAMFGFLLRLTVVFAGFWLTRNAEWMHVVAFGLTVVVAHLGLLFWEMKYISASLAFPGLKPTAPRHPGGPAAIKES